MAGASACLARAVAESHGDGIGLDSHDARGTT